MTCDECPALARDITLFIHVATLYRQGKKGLGFVPGQIDHSVTIAVLQDQCDFRLGVYGIG